MTDVDRPTILVPVRVLEGDQLETGIERLLANANVVLLGYHELPEQTATGQARMQYEDRAQGRLSELAERFADAGASVDTRLVFTHDRDQTLDRIAEETGALATLLANPAATMDDVVVFLRGDLALDRIVDVTGGLLADSEMGVTLTHVVGTDGETDPAASEQAATELLERARAELLDRGVDPDRVRTEIRRSDRPREAMAEAAEGLDAVIMGESDPSLVTFIFGDSSEQVADRFLRPVLVVRRADEE